MYRCLSEAPVRSSRGRAVLLTDGRWLGRGAGEAANAQKAFDLELRAPELPHRLQRGVTSTP